MTTSTATDISQLTAPDPVRADDVIIKCVKTTKVFRDFWMRNRVRAVDDIDLEVHRGEVFGLLGPNGSGKSTTIKMILGLLNVTSGTIAVFGKRPDDVANKKLIGYLPEETYLYRFLNARETLDYYGRLFHLPRHKRQSRIEELLRQVGMEHAAHRPIGEYSKGMQRKVGLAQALINDPDLLILDEPTSGMDPVATADVKRLIKTLAQRGKTVLLCSHLLSDVEDVCDRAAIMYGGKVREFGTIDELLVQQGMTTIRAESLDNDTIQQIEDVLNARGCHIDKVEQPRQTLESKFLEIVHDAQAEGLKTHGAHSGGEIAEFLADGAVAAPLVGQSVIDQLISSDQPTSSATESGHIAHEGTGEAVPDRELAKAVREDAIAQDAVIAGLVQKDEPAPQSEQMADAPAMPGQSEALAGAQNADLSVIDGLVSGAPAEATVPKSGDGNTAPAVDESRPLTEETPDESAEHGSGMFKSVGNTDESETKETPSQQEEVATEAHRESKPPEADQPKPDHSIPDEQPDQGFIDALMDTPRDDDDD